MEDKFDFNEVGKRMPYNVPDGFFDHMEGNILHDIHAEKPVSAVPNGLRIWMARLVPLAAAAIGALIFMPHGKPQPAITADGSYAKVEQAYENLSDADQSYLMETYHDDLFLNQ